MTAPTQDRPRVRPPIDPRIRERRIEVLREAGRRRLRVTLVVASAIVVIGLAYLALRSPLLDVDHIRITGARREPTAEIMHAARVRTGDALPFVNAGAVARRIERLPWVDRAVVRREFPGTLRVAVKEYVATVYVRMAPHRVALVASTGRVIAHANSAPPGAVEVIGQNVAPAVGTLLSPPEAADITSKLPRRLAAQVRSIDVRGPSLALNLRLVGKNAVAQIRLGSITELGHDELEDKGAAALAVLDHLAGRSCAYIDVAAPQAPVSRCDGAVPQ